QAVEDLASIHATQARLHSAIRAVHDVPVHVYVAVLRHLEDGGPDFVLELEHPAFPTVRVELQDDVIVADKQDVAAPEARVGTDEAVVVFGAAREAAVAGNDDVGHDPSFRGWRSTH